MYKAGVCRVLPTRARPAVSLSPPRFSLCRNEGLFSVWQFKRFCTPRFFLGGVFYHTQNSSIYISVFLDVNLITWPTST